MALPGNQHIIGLVAENVQRLTAVKFTFDPSDASGVKIITGKNDAGKSSVLNAMKMAIQGYAKLKSNIPEPIRKGKDKLCVVLETEDFIVEQSLNSAGKEMLSVKNRKNMKYPSAKSLLRGLLNTIGFDPMKFSEMNGKEQGEMLLKNFPIDIDLEKHEEERKMIYEARTETNREVKRLQAQLESMEEPQDDWPDEEKSVTDLNEEIMKLADERSKASGYKNELKSLNNSIESIEQQIKELQERKQKALARKKLLTDTLESFDEEKVSSEIEKLKASAGNIEKLNRQARAKVEWNKIIDLQEEQETIAKEHTDRIAALDKKKADAIAAAKFPVDGLSIDHDGGALLNGVPLIQCSSSQQIQVGVALAACGDSKLKLAFVQDGSLIDSEKMKTLAEMAKKYNLQVIMERVEDKSPAAIEIVEGSNIGAKDADGDLKSKTGKKASKKKHSKAAQKKAEPAQESASDDEPEDSNDDDSAEDLFASA